MPVGSTICATVEGILDAAVVKKVIGRVGANPGGCHVKNGKTEVRKKLSGYGKAARHRPWIVLIDLDEDADCAPSLRKDWLPAPEPQLCFRIAVRAVEAWLLADAGGIARFLRVDRTAIPLDPEGLADPKAEIVKLAGGSKSSYIRADMVPRPGSGRKTGPAYVSRLIEFVQCHWQPDRAVERSESLRRAIESLRRL